MLSDLMQACRTITSPKLINSVLHYSSWYHLGVVLMCFSTLKYRFSVLHDVLLFKSVQQFSSCCAS